ncbi:MAG: UDP-glucose/GDP-mannose dehydrogenase family protein [Acidimicrobiia bacterium]|nr:UDP-glucose/GDP-mannose dehydrogenase family protein [Acidimicrobiia bacterium]
MRVAVIGAGYVGLIQAAGLASLGHRVVIGERDPERISILRAGKVPFAEPGLAELLAGAGDRLSFEEDNRVAVRDAGVAFIAVPTPESADGSADLSIVDLVVDEVMSSLDPGAILAVKSTIPIGTIDRIAGQFRSAGRDDVNLASNPEFLAEGSAVSDFMNPDRIVIGARSEKAARTLTELYADLEAPMVVTDPVSAEMIKYASNAYLATRVTFGNAIANVCEAVGADVSDVLLGVGHDGRIGHHFMKPGPGFGGSCFPKDTKALVRIADAAGYRFSLLEGVIEVNEAQHQRVVEKVRIAAGGSLEGRTIGLLGLAYKAGTADLRGSPALELARLLQSSGALVRAFDPAVQAGIAGVETVASAIEATRGADVVLIATEWDEFVQLDLNSVRAAMSGDAIVDARNVLDPATVRAAELRYTGVGR